MTTALDRTCRALDTPPPPVIPGQLDLTQTLEPLMTTTTTQITCTGDDDCTAFAISAAFQPVSREEQAAKLRMQLAEDGWDCGAAGDLCPDCKGDEPGMCPACDTAAIERCVACGQCRCDTHETCIRPTP